MLRFNLFMEAETYLLTAAIQQLNRIVPGALEGPAGIRFPCCSTEDVAMTVVEIESRIPAPTRRWPANRPKADKNPSRPAHFRPAEDVGDMLALPLVSPPTQFPRVFPGL
jgi:hypothetical protein